MENDQLLSILSEFRIIIQENNDVSLFQLFQYLEKEESFLEEDIEIIEKEERRKSIINQTLIKSLKEAIQGFPEYYTGLIGLSITEFLEGNYKEASENALKAHQILNELKLHKSPLVKIASDLFDFTKQESEKKKIANLNYVKNIIKDKMALESGKTLLCSECGNYNERESKYCLECGHKFSRKERKEAK